MGEGKQNEADVSARVKAENLLPILTIYFGLEATIVGSGGKAGTNLTQQVYSVQCRYYCLSTKVTATTARIAK